ncbi:hypothetical protein GGU10DRAFT_8179 [Lentinula aff. detonsa]|uniref:Uncharacterized protein n=1 Tax=Lentinula aff. detonsa TaxID=2804958 RepID=A0AA38KA11_9AGAR|nr:hypothetical protein GGU10DRAFT_8179 [Lentinula aff. detonsa]
MPVATSTMINTHSNPVYPTKTVNVINPVVSDAPSKESNVKRNRALDKVYNRAARAFLNRNVALTRELLETGFKSLESASSNLTSLRKWDILRITFDTMLYTSPPLSPGSQINEVPFLHDMLSKTPQSFVEGIYTRSRQLFLQSENNTGTVLPSQVLATLVYSSLKADAPDVGRRMIEDWLAGRGDTAELSSSWMSTSTSSTESSMSDGYDADGSMNGDSPRDGINTVDGGDGYSKILELYCLQVLPKLDQWEYATEFLEYESELDQEVRDNLKISLQSLHAQAIASRLPSSSTSPSASSFSSSLSTPPPPTMQRAFSPAPSTSSSSSSLSTTSTHTVVPATPRARPSVQGMSPSTNRILEERSSNGSDGTITPRQRTNGPHHRRTDSKGKGKQRDRTPLASSPPSSNINAHPLSPNALTPLSLPSMHFNSASQRRQDLSTFALIKASIEPYINHITGASSANKFASLMVIFVVVPVFSFLVRMLRRRSRLPKLSVTSGFGAGAASADLVRLRLQSANANSFAMGALGKILAKAWWEIIRVVLDTVKMGGSGLV